MGLLSTFVNTTAKVAKGGADDIVRHSPSSLKSLLATGAIATLGFIGGNAVVIPALEGATGRDLPGGADLAGRTAANVGDALGNAWGSFTGAAGAGTARGISTGVAQGLGLPPGYGTWLLLGLGVLVLVQVIKD